MHRVRRLTNTKMRRSGGRAARRTEGVISAAFRAAGPAVRLSVAFLLSCTPITTRPDFRPDPRPLVVILNARPQRGTAALDSLLPADSRDLAPADVDAGHVETAWDGT